MSGGVGRRFRQGNVRHAERALIATQAGETLEQGGIGSAYQQCREQRVFLRPRRIDFVDSDAHSCLAEQIRPQHHAIDAGQAFDRGHTLRRNAGPV